MELLSWPERSALAEALKQSFYVYPLINAAHIALNKLKLAVPKTEKAEVLSKHLRDLVKTDSAIPVEILRRWISGR